jgi:hypothetical protein
MKTTYMVRVDLTVTKLDERPRELVPNPLHGVFPGEPRMIRRIQHPNELALIDWEDA